MMSSKFVTLKLGIKKNKVDGLLIYIPLGSNTAMIKTKNKFAASPVIISRENIKSGIIISISTYEDKVGLAVGISQDLTSKYNAVDLVKTASTILGGKGGGGRKDFAQAGGQDPNKINEAFEKIKSLI